MFKIKSLIITLSVTLLLLGCSSEEDKFVKQCIEDQTTSEKAFQLKEDKVSMALDCNGNIDSMIPRGNGESKDFHKSCFTEDKRYNNFDRAKMPRQIVTVEGQQFNCDVCTSPDRQPSCTDQGLAACWAIDEQKCEEQNSKIRNKYKAQCITAQEEIKTRSLGNIKADTKILREFCLRRLKG